MAHAPANALAELETSADLDRHPIGVAARPDAAELDALLRTLE